MTQAFYKLMLVTRLNFQWQSFANYLNFIQDCVNNGVTSIEIRAKHLSDDKLYEIGQRLQEVLAPYKVPLIVNDDLELATKLDADGVHLGQTDGDPQLARQKLGAHKIIGVSISDEQQLKNANPMPIDYMGVGPVFTTNSKPDTNTFLGLKALQRLTSLAQHPVIAIGGINEVNANLVMQAGVDGLATIAAIHDSSHPGQTTASLKQIIDHHHDSTNENDTMTQTRKK